MKNGLVFVLVCLLLISCGFYLKKVLNLFDDLKVIILVGDDEKLVLFELVEKEFIVSKVEFS